AGRLAGTLRNPARERQGVPALLSTYVCGALEVEVPTRESDRDPPCAEPAPARSHHPECCLDLGADDQASRVLREACRRHKEDVGRVRVGDVEAAPGGELPTPRDRGDSDDRV